MNLRGELVRGVHSHGYERPSAVQQRVIGPVTKGERGNSSNKQAAHVSAS